MRIFITLLFILILTTAYSQQDTIPKCCKEPTVENSYRPVPRSQQPEFRIGMEAGWAVDNDEVAGDYDINLLGSYGTWHVGIGVITNQSLSQGWGRRYSLGKQITDIFSVTASFGEIDDLTTTRFNYGLDIGISPVKGLHITTGVEAHRGPRIGVRILNWK